MQCAPFDSADVTSQVHRAAFVPCYPRPFVRNKCGVVFLLDACVYDVQRMSGGLFFQHLPIQFSYRHT